MRRLFLLLPLLLAATTAARAQIMPAPGIAPPSPLAPPISPGPAPAIPAAPSPILTRPGPALLSPLPGPVPAAPPAATPGPIDQQKMQSYRSQLQNRQRQFDLQGVSPSSQRYRDIQQQLDQPGR